MSDLMQGVMRLTWVLVGLALCAPGYAAQLKDPTKPPGAAAVKSYSPKGAQKKSRGWHLTSTLVSSERKVAVVNGRRVQIGDRINGARVVDIQPHAVKLRVNGKIVSIELSAGGFRKTTSED